MPYARYGESTESVCAQIESALAEPGACDSVERVQKMPPGAARNAIDCALWDLNAKRTQMPVWELAGLAVPRPTQTMRTVSIASVTQMKEAAAELGHLPVIKVKVDGGSDLERIAAVHEAAPQADLVVDANESWSIEQLRAWLPDLPPLGVTVLEQPLPAEDDEALQSVERGVRLCADESFHDQQSLHQIEGRYDMVNLKLDKAGGLTEALRCLAEARRRGLEVMVGCMVCTSLGIEPALLLTPEARYVDLDGPFLLEADRDGALHDRHAGLLRPSPLVWGSG